MSEEVVVPEVVLFRDLRTTEVCKLVEKGVTLADNSKVKVPYVLYMRGHERALEAGEEKNFEEIKPAKPLAEGEAEASGADNVEASEDNTVDPA